MNRRCVLAIVITAAAFFAGTAGAVDLAREPTLPKCKKGKESVQLVIKTNLNSGWDVNGGPAQHVFNPAWIQIPPSQWIGIHRHTPTSMNYVVHFFAPFPHGAMSVSAQWSTDNCGVSLQGGTGTPVPTGACNQGDKDFLISHNTSANFAAADVTDPNPAITFLASNELHSPTGLTGIFTVTASCELN
jgi:hypothetical protein